MYDRILVANDGSRAGYLALGAAFDIADRYGAELHMIIIEEFEPAVSQMEVPVILNNVMDIHCKAVIEKSNKLAAGKGIKLETHQIIGYPVPAIADFAKDYNFDLLVVGFMPHGAFYRWLIGSTTDGLVDDVPCSVLVVKAATVDTAEKPVDASAGKEEPTQTESVEGLSDRDHADGDNEADKAEQG